jgi:hypothetical protein
MAMGVTDEAKRLPEGRHSAVPGFTRDDEWQKVRVYEPTTEAGRPAVLWVLRMPAMFWRVTSGDIEMTTGSGDEMGDLADRIAHAIADGMLAFEK